MGQLELPFCALFASGSESSVAVAFAPSGILSLHPLFTWKVPGCNSSRVWTFHTWNFRSRERMVLGAKIPVPKTREKYSSLLEWFFYIV